MKNAVKEVANVNTLLEKLNKAHAESMRLFSALKNAYHAENYDAIKTATAKFTQAISKEEQIMSMLPAIKFNTVNGTYFIRDGENGNVRYVVHVKRVKDAVVMVEATDESAALETVKRLVAEHKVKFTTNDEYAFAETDPSDENDTDKACRIP